MAGAHQAAKRGDRLAIIAGQGRLPHDVALAARRAGEDPFVAVLRDDADRDWRDFDHVRIGTGDLSGLIGSFRKHDVGRVVLSGAVRRRPEWHEIRPTFRHLLRVPAVVRILLGRGDDTVLRMVIELLESSGYRVISAQEIVPGLVTDAGRITRATPDTEDWRDIEAGRQAALALGLLDIGQGAVSVGGRVVALEGPEGTDAMLQRVATLRAEGRISSRRRGVLVKFCKPQQDERADLPSVGLSTVDNARTAGLAGIAVEAGRSLVLERDETVRMAEAAGLFIAGITREDEGVQ